MMRFCRVQSWRIQFLDQARFGGKKRWVFELGFTQQTRVLERSDSQQNVVITFYHHKNPLFQPPKIDSEAETTERVFPRKWITITTSSIQLSGSQPRDERLLCFATREELQYKRPEKRVQLSLVDAHYSDRFEKGNQQTRYFDTDQHQQ